MGRPRRHRRRRHPRRRHRLLASQSARIVDLGLWSVGKLVGKRKDTAARVTVQVELGVHVVIKEGILRNLLPRQKKWTLRNATQSIPPSFCTLAITFVFSFLKMFRQLFPNV